VPLQKADVEMASCFPDVPECMVWEASSPGRGTQTRPSRLRKGEANGEEVRRTLILIEGVVPRWTGGQTAAADRRG
jgi:hypothetical protein